MTKRVTNLIFYDDEMMPGDKIFCRIAFTLDNVIRLTRIYLYNDDDAYQFVYGNACNCIKKNCQCEPVVLFVDNKVRKEVESYILSEYVKRNTILCEGCDNCEKGISIIEPNEFQ